MILVFKKKGTCLYTSYTDYNFYVAGKEIEVIPNLPYECGGLKKFRRNAKGRARSGFVVTQAELVTSDIVFKLVNERILLFKDGKKTKHEIHLDRATIHRSKKNWLCELEKAHTSERKCVNIFAKHFKISPDELGESYDMLRQCVNDVHAHKKTCPWFRARTWT